MRKVEDLKEYEVLSHKYLTDVNSDSYILRHKKTGARIALMPNDDDNKVFYIAFRTPPADSTGVAHIVEHTVLCGSDKYPIKDPFVELCKGSLNTFLNAMTFPDKTVYPIASCNEQDFRNLMDVYLDAVFHPNIYNEKKIFMQEGWHYEMESPEDDLKINGVVYSEMKGAFSDPDDIIERQIMNSVFPDTPYGVESGGDPDVIPNLSYKQFLDFHSKYYHPSNSYIFLYGNTDMSNQLEYIDKEYLSKYEKEEVDSEIPYQKPFDKRHDVKIEYPITEEGDLKDKTYLNLTYCFSDYKDKELPIVLRAFEYAFSDNPAAPLRKALLEAGIGNEVYASAECSLLQNMFGFYAKGANEEDKDKFIEIIEKELQRTFKEGFDKNTLISFLTREEFKYREADFGRTPKGLAYGIDLLESWLYDDEMVFDHLENLETYKFLKEAVNTDYFEKKLKEYFLDNTHSASIVGVPKKGLTILKENELKEKLSSVKASLSDKEIDKIINGTKALKEYQESEDSKEDLEKIKLLKISDIEKNSKKSKNILSELDGVKFLKQDIYTFGIAYLSLFFDLKEVDIKEYPYLPVLSSVFARMDTEKTGYGELSNEIKLYTGGMNTSVTSVKNFKTFDSSYYFELNAKFLFENKEKVFEILAEIIMQTVYDDKAKLKEYIAELRSQKESAIMSAPHTMASNRAQSHFEKNSVFFDMVSGIESANFIKELDDNIDERVDEVISILKTLVRKIFRKENLFVNLTATKENHNDLDNELKGLFNNLYTDKIEKQNGELTLRNKNEGFIFPGQVQFVALSGEYASKGYKFKGAFRVLRTMLGYDYLWNNVRVKGGAYGCFANFSVFGACNIVSYRDPHINNTLKVYRGLTEFVKNYECSDREMNQFIIGTISDIDLPQTASVEGRTNLMYYLGGIEDSDRQKVRDEVLNCKAEDIRDLYEPIKAAFENESICVIGSEAKIKDNSKLFDTVTNLI